LGATYIGSGEFLAAAGNLTVTGGEFIGSYPLFPGGPGTTTSPSGFFDYDNVLYPSSNPVLDIDGLLFTEGVYRSPGYLEINIWGNDSPGSYTFDNNSNGQQDIGGPFTLNANADPGGGQTFPAKYVFDVTAAPSCTNDFVAIGIPANPASGGQANLVGVNNLYSGGAG